MKRINNRPNNKRRRASPILGLIFAIISITSVISLYDFSGNGETIAMIRLFLPLVFGAASSLSFFLGGYVAYALIAGLGSIAFYVAAMMLATLLLGP